MSENNKLNCDLCINSKNCRFLTANKKQYGFFKMKSIKKDLPYDCGSFKSIENNNCDKCRFQFNSGIPCRIKEPQKDCRFFIAKKKKRAVLEERENTAADDYLDYLHDQW